MAETGYWRKVVRVKEDAEPIDNVNKFAWDDDDYEEIEEWVDYTEEELVENETEEKRKNFLETGDERLATVEANQDELLSTILDLVIGI